MSDTWRFDGCQWQEVTTEAPSGADYLHLIYDQARQEVLLLSGGLQGAGYGLWSWNGRRWGYFMGVPDGEYPLHISFHESWKTTVLLTEWRGNTRTYRLADGAWVRVAEQPMADHTEYVGFHRGLGNLVAFDERSRLWVFDDVTWHLAERSTEQPVHISYPKLAWHSGRRELVMVGHHWHSDNEGQLAVWGWNGYRWTPIETDGPAPAPRVFFGLSRHTPSQGIILFGGNVSLPWERRVYRDTWFLKDNRWEQVDPDRFAPPRYHYAHLAETVPGEVILLGEPVARLNQGSETWLSTPHEGWRRISTGLSQPHVLFQGTMAWDAHAQQLIIFGGEVNGQLHHETRRWNGHRWTHVTTSTTPINRNSMIMTYDRARGRTLMLDDNADAPVLWAFDGTNWTRAPVHNPTFDPLQYDGFTIGDLGYDEAREQVVLYRGGDRLLELDPGENHRPGVRLRVNASYADVPIESVTGLTVHGHVRGQGAVHIAQGEAPQTSDTVQLELWNARLGAWQKHAQFPSGRFEVSVDGPVIKELFVRTPQELGTVHVRLIPVGIDFRNVHAFLEVDALALDLHYDLGPNPRPMPELPSDPSPPPSLPSEPLVRPHAMDGHLQHPAAPQEFLPQDSCAMLPLPDYRRTSLRHKDPIDEDRWHAGDDVPAPANTTVVSVLPGTVLGVDTTDWGQFVRVRHLAPDGTPFIAIYGHLQNVRRQPNDTVTTGAALGKVSDQDHNGQLPPHLSFAIQRSFSPRLTPHPSTSDMTTFVDPVRFLAEHAACACQPNYCDMHHVAPGKYCDRNDVVICDEDEAGCLSARTRTPCPEGRVCFEGECVHDSCPAGGRRFREHPEPGEFNLSSDASVASFRNRAHLLYDWGDTRHVSYNADRREWLEHANLPREMRWGARLVTFDGTLWALGEERGNRNEPGHRFARWHRATDDWEIVTAGIPTNDLRDTLVTTGPDPQGRLTAYLIAEEGHTFWFDIDGAAWVPGVNFPESWDGRPIAAGNAQALYAVHDDSVWVLTAGGLEWLRVTPEYEFLQFARESTAVITDRRLFVLGGRTSQYEGRTDFRVFNLAELADRRECPRHELPTPLLRPQATMLPDGTLMLVGGDHDGETQNLIQTTQF